MFRDAREKRLAVFFELPLADAADFEEFFFVARQEVAHAAERLVGENHVRRDAFFQIGRAHV